MICNNIIECIIKSPLLKLNKIGNGNILAKLDFMQPSGSIKDVMISWILSKYRDSYTEKTFVEATTGNTGIALAAAGASLGFKTIIVMPEGLSNEREKIIKAFGAKIIKTPEEDGVKGTIEEAKKIAKSKNHVYINQFENLQNIESHYKITGKEIFKDTKGKIKAFVAAAGTGGTVIGVSKYLKRRNKNILIATVEPANSAVLTGNKPGPHKIEGIGEGFVPKIIDMNYIDRVIQVSDEDAISMTKRLAKEEGLFCGISSGANVWACLELLKEMKGPIVTILPDSGQRYFSTGIWD